MGSELSARVNGQVFADNKRLDHPGNLLFNHLRNLLLVIRMMRTRLPLPLSRFPVDDRLPPIFANGFTPFGGTVVNQLFFPIILSTASVRSSNDSILALNPTEILTVWLVKGLTQCCSHEGNNTSMPAWGANLTEEPNWL